MVAPPHRGDALAGAARVSTCVAGKEGREGSEQRDGHAPSNVI